MMSVGAEPLVQEFPVAERTCRVFAGSTWPVPVQSGTSEVSLVVRSVDAGGSDVLFDRKVELGDEVTTTLRVTR